MTRTLALPHRWQPTMYLDGEVAEWTCAANFTSRFAHSIHGVAVPPEGTCLTIVLEDKDE